MKRWIANMVPALLCVAVFGATLYLFVIPHMEDLVMDQKRQLTRELVLSVSHMLDTYEQQVRDGRLSRMEAQRRALSRIRAMRYGPEEQDYFYINNLAGFMIMHPYRPDMEGKDLTLFPAPDGQLIFKEATRIAREKGGGWMTYSWQWKNDPNRFDRKLAYVRLFKPWGWIVVTGVYMNDIQREMQRLVSNISTVILGAFALVILLSGFITFRGLRVEKERNRALEEAHASETHYKALFESANDAIFLIKDRVIVDANAKSLEVFGLPREKILGKSPIDLSPKHQADGGLSDIEGSMRFEAAEGGEPQFFPWIHKRGDSRTFDAEVSLTKVDLPKGTWLLSVVRDVEERRRSALELAWQKAYFEELFHSSPEAVAVTDDKGRITRVNQEFVKLFGYMSEDVIGRPIGEVTKGDANPEYGCIAQRITSGEKVRTETVRLTRQGRDIHVSLSAAPIILGGVLEGSVALYQDITERVKAQEERHRLEEELFQSRKMEAMGTLAGGIAHDFNNILTAIIGFTELGITLSKSGKTPLNEFNHVLEASFQARDLVRQILTFSQEKGGKTFPLDMGSLVKGQIRLIEASTPSHITVTTRVDAAKAVVEADPVRLQQVLLNLCSNAIHAMEITGGKLDVTVSEVWLDKAGLPHPEMDPGAYVELRVADTGVGMTREVANRVFDPFFTTKGPGKGTGMGLSVVHGIVKAMGGGIKVESWEGKGTEFRVYFPKSGKQPAVQTPIGQPQAIGRFSGRVLLVEDEEAVLQLADLLLTEMGLTVEPHQKPQEAKEAFMRSPLTYDLVITDFAMPGLSGLDLTAALKEINPHIQVLMMTGLGSMMDRSELDRFGVDGLLIKPFSRADLADALVQVNRALTEMERNAVLSSLKM